MVRKLWNFQYSVSITQTIFDKLSRKVNPKQAKRFWKREKEHSEKRDKLTFKPITNIRFSTIFFRKVFLQRKHDASQNYLKTKKSHSEKRDSLTFKPIINFRFSTKFSTKISDKVLEIFTFFYAQRLCTITSRGLQKWRTS